MCVARRLARLLVHPRGPAGRAGGVVWSATLTHSAAGGAAPAHARPSTPSNTATPATEERQLVHVIKQTIYIHTYIYVCVNYKHNENNIQLSMCSPCPHINECRRSPPPPHSLRPRGQARRARRACNTSTSPRPWPPRSPRPRCHKKQRKGEKIKRQKQTRTPIKQESEMDGGAIPPP